MNPILITALVVYLLATYAFYIVLGRLDDETGELTSRGVTPGFACWFWIFMPVTFLQTKIERLIRRRRRGPR